MYSDMRVHKSVNILTVSKLVTENLRLYKTENRCFRKRK